MTAPSPPASTTASTFTAALLARPSSRRAPRVARPRRRTPTSRARARRRGASARRLVGRTRRRPPSRSPPSRAEHPGAVRDASLARRRPRAPARSDAAVEVVRRAPRPRRRVAARRAPRRSRRAPGAAGWERASNARVRLGGRDGHAGVDEDDVEPRASAGCRTSSSPRPRISARRRVRKNGTSAPSARGDLDAARGSPAPTPQSVRETGEHRGRVGAAAAETGARAGCACEMRCRTPGRAPSALAERARGAVREILLGGDAEVGLARRARAGRQARRVTVVVQLERLKDRRRRRGSRRHGASPTAR